MKKDFSDQIKSRAIELGFEKIGITKAEPISKEKAYLESGINNMLNSHYFTRRATGYPGPGIIPSPPRNTYITLQYKF